MTPDPAGSAVEPDAAAGTGLFRIRPEGTGSRGSRAFGLVLLAGTALFLAVALVLSPSETVENGLGEQVRIMYVHVPVAIAAYLAFSVTALSSIAYLWKRTEGWDLLAAASAEVGVVFTGLTLVTGSIWGHISWGTWWEWDARLTSTLLLFVLYLGYLALRRAVLDPVIRAKRSAIAGLIAFANVPIVHYSVSWWRSLHQEATIGKVDPTIDGLRLFSLMFGMVLAVALFVWLMIHRFRLQYLAAQLEAKGLDLALAERRAEAAADAGRPAGLAGASEGAR